MTGAEYFVSLFKKSVVLIESIIQSAEEKPHGFMLFYFENRQVFLPHPVLQLTARN
jgi:hypothetical protein